MTVFQIKIIAIVSMVIDHIGAYLFPDIIILRIIGRISFPLFAWLIANGSRYTHSRVDYLKRLLIFCIYFPISLHLDQ